MYRNESYKARMQLAVLDYNAHVSRRKQKNQKGEQMFHQKYRKASKKWDVTPIKEKKDYSYFPDLMGSILDFRKDSSISMKQKQVLPANHPACVQATIGHKPPTATNDIVEKKSSRFS